MNMEEALGIIQPKGDDLGSLKKAYRKAAMKYHPDRNPDGLEIMKLVNQAFDFLKKHLGKWSTGWAEDATKRAKATGSVIDQVMKLWAKVAHLPGIKGEVIGTWLWITGDTRAVKDHLKAAGFRFSPKKRAWFWHAPGYRKRSNRTFEMGEIRQMWGSQDLDNEELQQVG